MVVVKLLGGLGNQMFQYAAARSVANRLGVELLIDISAFESYDLRRYELASFRIHGRVASLSDVNNIGFSNQLPAWILCLLRMMGFLSHPVVYKESSFAFDENILKVSPPIYLDGYWQSEQYFFNLASDLRREFTLNQPLDEVNHKMLEQIQHPSREAVSLHIRRGDYVSNAQTAQFHGLCSLEYYRLAVDYISENVSNPHFFIFSDDLKWVRENLLLNHPMTLVDVNDANHGVFDITLMSSCRHHIIANSSFSWWGAWLNSYVGKIVIAPKRWFADATLDTSDLIPGSWIRL